MTKMFQKTEEEDPVRDLFDYSYKLNSRIYEWNLLPNWQLKKGRLKLVFQDESSPEKDLALIFHPVFDYSFCRTSKGPSWLPLIVKNSQMRRWYEEEEKFVFFLQGCPGWELSVVFEVNALPKMNLVSFRKK